MPNKGRFAGTIGPCDNNERTFSNLQADSVKTRGAVCKAVTEIFDFDDEHFEVPCYGLRVAGCELNNEYEQERCIYSYSCSSSSSLTAFLRWFLVSLDA